MKIPLCWFVTLAGVFACAGCETPKATEAYNVRVRLADSLSDGGRYPVVDVFIKGASEWERQRDWPARANITDYPAYVGAEAAPSESNSPGPRVLRLGGDQSPAGTLADSSAAWHAWAASGAKWLVIITNYPRSKPSADDRDRRMLILPLDRSQYPDNNLQVDVTANGLDLHTPPRVVAH